MALRLETIGTAMRARGLTFGWHNHAFEFVALPTGEIPHGGVADARPID